MLQATQLRNGTIFEYQDEPYKVLDYKHTHMGRGSADVRVKIKGLVSKTVLSKNFSPEEKFNEAALTKKECQYLYHDTDKYYFMDPDTFEQIELDRAVADIPLGYLKEGEKVKVLFWEEQPITAEIPKAMVFLIAEADPGAKGNSAVNVFKTVTTDSGLTVKVPLFINRGDRVKVNTQTGEYAGRA